MDEEHALSENRKNIWNCLPDDVKRWLGQLQISIWRWGYGEKGKAILKQTGAGIFSYVLFCLGGAYESYYRGANMGFTACIAVCAIAFLLFWGQ